MIDIGCCAFCFKPLGLEQALQLLTGMGFRNISVGLNHAGAQVSPLEAAEDPSGTARKVKAAFDKYDARLVELFMCPLTVEEGVSVVPNHPDASLRARMLEAFKGICEFAAEAGAQNIMGVPGTPQEDLEDDTAWAYSIETLNRMVNIAGQSGAGFSIEPHRGSIIHDSEKIQSMLEAVPGLKLTLDYAHFVGKGVSEKALFSLHEHTLHLHARPAFDGNFNCKVELNDIDFRAIMSDLKARNWSGVVSTECFGDTEKFEKMREHPAFQNALMADIVERAIEQA